MRDQEDLIAVPKLPNYIQWRFSSVCLRLPIKSCRRFSPRRFVSYFHGNHFSSYLRSFLTALPSLNNPSKLCDLVFWHSRHIWRTPDEHNHNVLTPAIQIHGLNMTLPVLLLAQDLREECLKLRTRVFDLEQQNRALGVLFQQRIKPASDLLLQVCSPLRCSHLQAATEAIEEWRNYCKRLKFS